VPVVYDLRQSPIAIRRHTVASEQFVLMKRDINLSTLSQRSDFDALECVYTDGA